MLKKQIIIEQTLSLVNTYGLEELSMRKIALHCEIPLSSLYTHYKSKNELLNAVFCFSIEKTCIIDIDASEDISLYLLKIFQLIYQQKEYYCFISKYYKSSFVDEETKRKFESSFKERQKKLDDTFKNKIDPNINFDSFYFMIHAILKEIVYQGNIKEENLISIVYILISGIKKGN